MDEILAHLADNNLFPGELTLNGKIHRFKVDEGDTKQSGWYLGYANHTRSSGELFYVVVYGNYRTSDTFRFRSDHVTMSAEDKKAMKDQIAKAQKQSEEEQTKYQEQVSEFLNRKWLELSDSGVNEYLARKQISEMKNLGIKFDSRGDIHVPACDVNGKIWSAQTIKNDGTKLFFSWRKN